MKIQIIGKTEFQGEFPGKADHSAFHERWDAEWDKAFATAYATRAPNDGQTLIEFAGRLCYESWDLPNPKTATNSGYIENIISQGHESVLEHVSVTFYVEGVSRNLSHELIRHRHLSFSELSQRFVDMSDAQVVIAPALKDVHPKSSWDTKPTEAEDYEGLVDILMSYGKTRKQAREAARYILPAGMETKLVVTGNLRAWRDVLKKRDSEHADAEMQLFAKEIKRQLLIEYPDVFKDLDEG